MTRVLVTGGSGKAGRACEVFIIANADSVMRRPNAELMAEQFPTVPLAAELGPNETLLSITKARRTLGYEPQHSWRDQDDAGEPSRA